MNRLVNAQPTLTTQQFTYSTLFCVIQLYLMRSRLSLSDLINHYKTVLRCGVGSTARAIRFLLTWFHLRLSRLINRYKTVLRCGVGSTAHAIRFFLTWFYLRLSRLINRYKTVSRFLLVVRFN